MACCIVEFLWVSRRVVVCSGHCSLCWSRAQHCRPTPGTTREMEREGERGRKKEVKTRREEQKEKFQIEHCELIEDRENSANHPLTIIILKRTGM